MIEELLKGLKTLADTAGNFTTSIGGRWYSVPAPKGATFPYATVEPLPLSVETVFDATIYTIPITIMLYSNSTAESPSELDDIFGYFETLFFPTTGGSWKAVTVTGYTQIWFRPVSVERFEGDDVWQYTIDMEWKGQEN